MARDSGDLPDVTEENIDGPSGSLVMADPDPYASKDGALEDVTKTSRSLIDIGNEVDAGDTIYSNPRVSADSGGPSKHGQVIGNLASLITGDPRVGASVAAHLDSIGVAKYDNSLGNNLQQFANLLTTQTQTDGKAMAAASQKEAETADKASAGASQKLEAQMIADAVKKASSQSGGGGEDSGGGIMGMLGF